MYDRPTDRTAHMFLATTNEELLKRFLELASTNYVSIDQEEYIEIRKEILHRMSYYKDLFS